MKKNMMTSNSPVNAAWAERGFHFDRPNFGNWFAGQIGKERENKSMEVLFLFPK